VVPVPALSTGGLLLLQGASDSPLEAAQAGVRTPQGAGTKEGAAQLITVPRPWQQLLVADVQR